MTKKVSKILLYSFLTFIVSVIVVATYTQTGAFRSNLRSALYEIIKNNLNASVYLGEISGNLVTGFTIDTVMIYVDNAPFIECGRIGVKYNILDVLDKDIRIDTLTIENPSVHLIRWQDSSWNVDHMSVSPASRDTTPTQWKISARKIRLINASFRLIDSTGEVNKSVVIDGRKSINYSNIVLKEMYLSAGASYSSESIRANIERLSFVAPKEQFTLLSLSADCLYSKDTARVSQVRIQTPHTTIKTSAEMTGVDLFSVSELTEFEHAPVRVTLEESDISTSDLQVFLPELYFLKGDVKLKGVFHGTFAQLNVQSLTASFGSTSLSLAGTVSNMHKPKELRLNIVSNNSSIYPPDVPQLLPYFGIPLYSRLGQVTLDFQFVGKPLDFVVISKVQSAAGTVTVDGELLITEDNLHYKGLLAGSRIDLEKIFDNADVASTLNTKAYIEGKGTSIEQLNTEARLEIDSSLFRGIPVSSAVVEVKAEEKTIDAEITLNSPDVNMRATALLDFRLAEPAYMLSARVRNLNLAPVLNDPYYTSRLSFDVSRAARSFNLLDGLSNTTVQILPSTFQQYRIDSSDVNIKVEVDSSNLRRISVRSPIADGELYGSFTFDGFLKALQRGVAHITRLYSYQRTVIDSTYEHRVNEQQRAATEEQSRNDIQYALTVKNLRPIAVFFKLPMMDAQAEMNGRLTGNAQTADFSGLVQMKRGMIESDSALIQFSGATLHYSLNDLPESSSDLPLPLLVELNLNADEINVNRTAFRNPKFFFTYNGQQGDYRIYSDIDTTISVAVEGGVFTREEEEELKISTLRVKYQGYNIQNYDTVFAYLNTDGISLDSALFTHRDQTLLLDGTYNFSGGIEAIAEIQNFSMQDLYYFSRSMEFRDQALSFGGTVSAKASAKGTIQDPALWVEINGEHLSFKQSQFGHFVGTMTYADKVAEVHAELHNMRDSAETRDIALSGKIPIDLRLTDVQDRSNLDGMDVTLKADNLQIAVLDPFVPEITLLNGVVKTDVRITGSLNQPLMTGTTQLSNCQWVLDMTGIMYETNGTVLLDGNKALFTDVAITNLLNDYPDGRMNVGGYIALKGFTPHEYHLSVRGELLVLHERSRTQGASFFGTLVASTGNDSLRFDGSFERSRVQGIVYVQQASLIFPPTQQAQSYSASLFNMVEFIDDTSKVVRDTVAVEALINHFQTVQTPLQNRQRTFLDGFGYNITIVTRGTVRVNMIFNANAGAYEELYAELDGKLTLSKAENGVQLKGTINVGNESKYTFYKTFNATGALTFDGDPQNPRLNIAATYEGTHCINSSLLKDDCIREEKVVVTLNITGTRLSPQVKLGLKTIDPTGKETVRSGDVENDAIAFLLTSSPGTPGKFRDELTAQDRNRISEQLTSTIGGTFLNSMLSGYVMEFITRNNIPYVKRVEVSDVGADPNINVRLELFDAIINAGGRVFSNINNTNISIQRPILGKENRNFMLEVEKKTENFTYSLESRTILSARIFYRFTF